MYSEIIYGDPKEEINNSLYRVILYYVFEKSCNLFTVPKVNRRNTFFYGRWSRIKCY
jgi:hypothetical protein